ncbi:MAG: hypothetical protein LBK47_10785 [Prevotellaceae bacterium]|jgi:hypothetical protein|nr:hypothetical protein [Prevotellaceae bacterium]
MICSKKILLIASLPLLVSACKYLPGSNEPLAKVGNKTLYQSDLGDIYPKNADKADSVIILKDYVNAWCKKELLIQQAEDNLSTAQKDVSRQLEDYRASLLIYRYEQEYIEQRLNKKVSDAEIEAFYNTNKSSFVLSTPLVNVLFIKLKKNTPYLDKIKKLYTSNKPEDRTTLEELCLQVALKYDFFNEKWVELNDIVRDLPKGKKYEDMAVANRKIEVEDAQYVYLIAIRGYLPRGTISPLDYESDNIKNLIINKRKQDMIGTLEEHIFADGKKENRVTIFIDE